MDTLIWSLVSLVIHLLPMPSPPSQVPAGFVVAEPERAPVAVQPEEIMDP